MTDGGVNVYSTGLPELDTLIGGLQPGDNVVWQIDRLDQYLRFCRPFCERAKARGIPVVYFRFAHHEPIVEPGGSVNRIVLSPHAGFEHFIDSIHSVVAQQEGRVCYVFDCLSDLAADWFSDLMLGNFFVLTCPYILHEGHVAYFALLRNRHSNRATAPIRNTTQLFIDVYSHESRTYLRPLKAKQREASGVAMLHRWTAGAMDDITDSCTIAEILNASTRSPLYAVVHPLDVWQRAFMQLDDLEKNPPTPNATMAQDLREKLLRMVVSRDTRMLDLARTWLNIADLQAIGRRTIGSGLIGGKAVGMLLARAILRRGNDKCHTQLEAHDSFYVASDVFYTFLVHNGCWHIRRMLKRSEAVPVDDAAQAQRRMLDGVFPDDIMAQFAAMLDYFGQSPIIVRSSSLLEDDFGNSFAGKYESIFCANQGSHEERLAAFLDAVRRIYASTLSQEALEYRTRRGLLDRDEQMALLVQRVSGARYGRYFFPQFAGVAYSFNPYAWSRYIDANAGVARLVFGLGTRAVDRTDDDYTRIVALNAPLRIPDADEDGQPRTSQRHVDVLDLVTNEFVTIPFADLAMEMTTNRPPVIRRIPASVLRDSALAAPSHVQLDLKPLLSRTNFVESMRHALATLQHAYAHAVDIEFAINFQNDTDFKIHLLQCRPFHYQGNAPAIEYPEPMDASRIFMEGNGPIIGHSRAESLDTIVWVPPDRYETLPIKERYALARALGTALRRYDHLGCTLLLGPGRWGTSTPSLGVPVSFAEINAAAILVEIVAADNTLMPDLSIGTHFFGEMVEADMMYIALTPDRTPHSPAFHLLRPYETPIGTLADDLARFSDTLHIASVNGCIKCVADTANQRVICYREDGATSASSRRNSSTI